MHIFCFILFYRITYDPFCSIKIKITTFDRLGFTFAQRYVVVKDVSVKGRHISANLITLVFKNKKKLNPIAYIDGKNRE